MMQPVAEASIFPRVSVIIPTYNRADLLPFTLQSALDQRLPAHEIIVVDNASTDDTPALMAQHAARVRYIRKPINKGQVDSYNMGFRESSGDYILFLDSDDTIHPDMLAKQVGYLEQHRDADLVRSGGYYVDAGGNPFARMRLAPAGPGRQLLASLVFGNFEMCGSLMYRRAMIERVGLREESLPVYSDWDYNLRIALLDCRFGFIADPLFNYRFHAGNSMKKVQVVETASDVILEKLFTNPALPPAISPLRNEALAQAHLFLAFSYYSAQAPEDAQRCLLRAWHDHPRWQADPAALLDALLDYTLYMHVDELESFAHHVMANLPAELANLHDHEAAWLSHIHLLLAFKQYDRGDFVGGKTLFNRALTVNPALVADRKTFATLLRKFALQAVTDPPAAFVQAVLDHVPPEAQALRSLRRVVQADLELIAAYASMKDNDRQTALHLMNALRLQPSLAGRRGVLAPLLRSLTRPLKRTALS